MPVAILLECETTSRALEHVCRIFGLDIIQEPRDARIVIIDDAVHGRKHLEGGRHVVQFIWGAHIVPAQALADDGRFSSRFRIFRPYRTSDGNGGALDLCLHLQQLAAAAS